MPKGYLALVLHAHLPFVRHPEHQRHLEERWLYEAMIECYIPLIQALDRLERDQVPCAFTMSLTPTLGDMLQDELLCQRFETHLERIEALQRKEARRVAGHSQLESIVTFYGHHLRDVRTLWERYHGNLVQALVHHARQGRIELIASTATHAFLPGLLSQPRALQAQIRVGLEAFRKQTGLQPIGMWLPECAYDPAFDRELAHAGVRFTVLEEHGLQQATPRPFHGVYQPIASPSGVAFFGRDVDSGQQVWSRHDGYPGDPYYREFYRDIGFDLPEDELLGEVGPYHARICTGLKYHRVTGPNLDLSLKELYQPSIAQERAWEHARHFVECRHQHLMRLSQSPSLLSPPILVAPYDVELFGHWWFEGPWFLEGVFRHLAQSPRNQDITPITLRDFLSRHPNLFVAVPAASTWGVEGHRRVWVDPSNAYLWRHIHHACREFFELLDRYRSTPDALTQQALHQAAVELLLLQASDWPFILYTKTAEEYAASRARAHTARLHSLLKKIREQNINRDELNQMAARDDFLHSLGQQLISLFV